MHKDSQLLTVGFAHENVGAGQSLGPPTSRPEAAQVQTNRYLDSAKNNRGAPPLRGLLKKSARYDE